MSGASESGSKRATPGGPSLQYLSFSLGEEVFALDIRTVREIIQYGAVTAVPLVPEFVRGVINLRGAVVPVIDLQVRFARPRATVGKKTCIVIFESSIEGERIELGLMVDMVSEVIDISQDLIEAPPQFGTSIPREFIRGMGKVDGEFVVIIEPDRALNIEELAQLAEREVGV